MESLRKGQTNSQTQQTTNPVRQRGQQQGQKNMEVNYQISLKPVLRGHSKNRQTKILMTNGSLMKVESIADFKRFSQKMWYTGKKLISFHTLSQISDWPIRLREEENNALTQVGCRVPINIKKLHFWNAPLLQYFRPSFASFQCAPIMEVNYKIQCKTKILMTNGSLMKVESIAECSIWSILQYFWPALTIFGLENKFLVFLELPF